MIRGLEKFKDFFRDFQGQYVLIGGSACDILLEETGIQCYLVDAPSPTCGQCDDACYA